ncbi:MAG: aldehyde dehydrogenase [Mycobacterium sp.]|jgi:aldehyde dehydrogenase (NAD+)|nr:aldehyde dehydrogenase [Mycobacterium sp.]MDT5143036.1 aldehyde dehydrogenase [Mycobacterium sp.]MDT5170325.1 aldehyde dehydrogenase [Mycobacterium sp.]MDT5200392.1 aldehyde dehydrogenase [Mycobacterium sp.]MDT5254282.1 aldehyde dehydrogenase [Mycobacterium sp.]
MSTPTAAAPARSQYHGLFVDGAWRSTETDAPVLNPATEQPVATAPWGGVADADAAVSAARRAFDDGPWPRMTPAERSTALRRLRDVLADWADDIVGLVVAEAGIPVSVARPSQFDAPMQLFDFFIERCGAFETLRPLPLTTFRSRHGATVLGAGVVQRSPRGVVVAITPFNAPFFVNLLKVGPALAAGCTVVLKPSDFTPLEALLLGAAAQEAGLPSGVLNVVTGGVEVGEYLTTDPRVDMITFTGSDAVGAKVMAQASASLKHVTLELGGKSAMIVRADADLDLAAARGAQELTLFTGQGCALWTRHLVHRSIYDGYLERVTATLQRLPIGDPTDARTVVGPLIRDSARSRAEKYVAGALEQGARLVSGGRRPAHLDRGYYYEPTLLADVRSDMTVAQQEVFGPVGAAIPFDDDDEAVRIANDSAYGLSGSIWTADPGAAFAMAQRIQTGNVSINGGTGGMSPWAPFGGYKRSGVGRELGAEVLDDFTETKAIQFHAG